MCAIPLVNFAQIMNLTYSFCNLSQDMAVPERVLYYKVLERVRVYHFPDCKDLLSADGLTEDDLFYSVCCVSMALKHETVLKHVRGKEKCFVCGYDKSGDSSCPFDLRFIKKGDRYFFKRSKLFTVSMKCSWRSFPEICLRREFLKPYIKKHLEDTCLASAMDCGQTTTVFR